VWRSTSCDIERGEKETEVTAAEAFWWHVRVQFDDTDAQGRVFYANYFSLIDQARCAFWEGMGFSEAAARQIEYDTVIVHVEADYLGPAEFYDLLRIYVTTEELGRSSLRLAYRVVHERTDQDIFTARMVMVHVDLTSERSKPWGEEFRNAIIAHHGPQVVKS
jgi:acyl-CoA thioester hydrolase